MNLIDAIRRDHNLLKNDIAFFESLDTETPGKRIAAMRIIRLVRAQTAAEEVALLETLENDFAGNACVLTCIDQHDEAEELMEDIEEELAASNNWSFNLNSVSIYLLQVLERHMQYDEGVLFPMIEKTFSANELAEMKLQYAQIRRQSLEEYEQQMSLKPKLDAIYQMISASF